MPDKWSSIGDAAALRERGLFVAEGRRVLQRLLGGAAGGPDAIVAALATPAAVQALGLGVLGPRLEVCEPSAMEALTGFNFHRGALALVRRQPPRSPFDVIEGSRARGGAAPDPGLPTMPGAADVGSRPVYVVGEQIADADNVGSLFRNARALGAAAVLLDDRSVDPLYRKAVRTSLGAVLDLAWTTAPYAVIEAALSQAGVTTVGLTPDASAPSLAAVVGGLPRPPSPIALVVGNEGVGLSAAALGGCSRLARVPMAAGADSLNVATALAVGLYELTRS